MRRFCEEIINEIINKKKKKRNRKKKSKAQTKNMDVLRILVRLLNSWVVRRRNPPGTDSSAMKKAWLLRPLRTIAGGKGLPSSGIEKKRKRKKERQDKEKKRLINKKYPVNTARLLSTAERRKRPDSQNSKKEEKEKEKKKIDPEAHTTLMCIHICRRHRKRGRVGRKKRGRTKRENEILINIDIHKQKKKKE
jgi:hypothetical protein